MSALPPKAATPVSRQRVRYGPFPDACTAPKKVLFDHFVGGHEQRCWNYEAERFCGVHVYNELDFGRLLNRQLSRLVAFKNAADVNAQFASGIEKVRSVAHKATGQRILAIRHRATSR
jgi:hypothetical protein